MTLPDSAELDPEREVERTFQKLGVEFPDLVHALRDIDTKTSPDLAASTSTERSDTSVDVHIPDFKILRILGQGGFGCVYLARNIHDQNLCAVKIVHPDRESELDGIRAYQNRSRSNPFLISINHVGKVDGRFYYVMRPADHVVDTNIIDIETYDPLTLAKHIRIHGQLSARETNEIVSRLLLGLEQLHGSGLAHCDIKPSNILCIDGTWTLGDPGLVKPLERVRDGGGTRDYLPPEEHPNGVARDLYALGVTMRGMLGGSHSATEPLKKAIADDPTERFQSAREMYDCLNPASPSSLPSKNYTWMVGVLGVLLAAIACAFFYANDFQGKRQKNAATSLGVDPVQVALAKIQLFGPVAVDEKGDRLVDRLGVWGISVFHGIEGGCFTIDVTLSRSTTACLILMDPNGDISWVPTLPHSQSRSLPLTREVRFPPAESGKFYSFENATGSQVVFVVQSVGAPTSELNVLVERLKKSRFEQDRQATVIDRPKGYSFDGIRYSTVQEGKRGHVVRGPKIPTWFPGIVGEIEKDERFVVLAGWAVPIL